MSRFVGPFIKILLVVLGALLPLEVKGRLPTPADLWMISPRERTLLCRKSFQQHPQAFRRSSLFQRLLVKRHFLPQNRPFPTARSRQIVSSRIIGGQGQLQTLMPKTCRRILVKRHLLDFFDPLEPVELAWEFYVNRYEILDELVARLSKFARRHSVRAGIYFVTALGAAEILARLGFLGGKKQSLVRVLKDSRRVNEGVEERFYQKTSSWMLNHAMGVFSTFRHMGNKSKFAISVSAGGLFGELAIQSTVLAVKTVLISFFVLETAAFLGIIGEPGESILDFVEDEYARNAAWTTRMVRWHKTARHCMNLEVLEQLYEACIDEEKIASFGFSVGTVFALLT